MTEESASRATTATAPASTTALAAAPATVGDRLLALRQARGLTQSALATQAGVRASTLSRWENGKRQPLMPELEAVLDALEASASDRRAILQMMRAPRALTRLRSDAGAAAPPVSGDLLQALRLRKGWTQAQTAHAVGVNQSQIAWWEKGDAWPSAEALHSLCWHLEASGDEVAELTFAQGGGPSYGRGSAEEQAEPELPPSGVSEPEAIFPWLDHVDGYLVTPKKPFTLNILRLQHRLSVLASEHLLAEQLLPNAYAIQARHHHQRAEFRQAQAAAQRGLALARRHRLSSGGNGSRSLWFGSAIVLASCAAQRGPSGSTAGLQHAIQILTEWLPAVKDCPAHYVWGRTEIANYLARAGRGDEAVIISASACRHIARTRPEESPFRLHDHAHVLCQVGRPQEALRALDSSRNGGDTSALFRVRQELLEAQCLLALDDRHGADERLRVAEHIARKGRLTTQQATFLAFTTQVQQV